MTPLLTVSGPVTLLGHRSGGSEKGADWSAYLHGHGVFNEHRSQLSVQLKEDLPLAGLVQVAQRQRLDVEGLPSLQLHLRIEATHEINFEILN